MIGKAQPSLSLGLPVSTGNLLAILNQHYQDLSCLAFTNDTSHFLSGAKDSLVIVWNLFSVLQAKHIQGPEPRHVWSQHSLPITDLYCGVGGAQARVATASLDQTAKPDLCLRNTPVR
ncbi:WD repeat-containing protein 18 [Varanus komodoensis]|nr:WD repeat-containing protein 18 [Varanus komodoensis]